MKKFVFTLLLGIAFVFTSQANSFDNDVGNDVKVEYNQADQVQSAAFVVVELPENPSLGNYKQVSTQKEKSLKAEVAIVSQKVSKDVIPKLPDIHNSRIGLYKNYSKDTDTAKVNHIVATSGGLPLTQTCS